MNQFVIFMLSQLLLSFAQAENIEVTAPAGKFVGTKTATGKQFLGIPYALAPLGDLRFAPPKTDVKYLDRFDATKFGSVCLQPEDSFNLNPKPGDKVKGSEDCLFLNIYSSLTESKNKPVMVWIHGGGFVTGSGSEYDLHKLAEKQDVIGVTLNYRLGTLGFLSHPGFGEESGNFGLLDQQAALKWIQKNIKAFGGDPDNVTIFGESAGGMSVCHQLLSPSSKGLYKRALFKADHARKTHLCMHGKTPTKWARKQHGQQTVQKTAKTH